jgi:predicted AAA+ superfamily ATPase
MVDGTASLFPRWIEERVVEALSDTRVVLLSGPRQAGKTTLVRRLTQAGTPFLTLDDPTALRAATADPVSFIRGLDRATIDEVQRVPDVLLAIKRSVDEDARPGRFLLTGSANLLTVPRIADSLAGRMGIINLLPLSQAEMRGARSTFLQQVFAGAIPKPGPLLNGLDLVASVLAGGYPEAVRRLAWRRQRAWYLDYVRAILERDVRDVAQVERLPMMHRLLVILAHHAAQLVNHAGLGAQIGLNHVTTQRYVGVLEQLFLIRLLPPWSANSLSRLVKTPKLHFIDAGLLCALRNVSPQRVAADRGTFGAVLETFVVAELLKHASWSDENYTFSHYRDKDLREVDVVVENADMMLVGIEVKAAASVSESDFRGLRRLEEKAGSRFRMGLVLHDGTDVVFFGPKLAAVPLCALWSS